MYPKFYILARGNCCFWVFAKSVLQKGGFWCKLEMSYIRHFLFLYFMFFHLRTCYEKIFALCIRCVISAGFDCLWRKLRGGG